HRQPDRVLPQRPQPRLRDLPLGAFRDHQEDLAAGHVPGGARRVDPLGSRAVRPLRHQRRQSGLRGARVGRGETMDVLLVAVKKDKIGDYTSVITQAGKTPVLVDVDAFAVQNAYEINYPVEPGRVVALVNIGASVTN